MTTLPGLGAATPLPDLLDNYRRLVNALPDVIRQHPAAFVVRNQVGNLSVVVQNADGTADSVGWIDMRTGEINVYDEIQRAADRLDDSDYPAVVED